ncbi:hypothetical protein B0O41_2352 [Propionibacteriaceae bacterium ES.041]|uniref:YbaB/EbfC family DNA-binding protein n=1 Tax=Enemella evansiae TaxID=2016499 RepID=A0A255GEV0_9ACTN|nr:hypothetical protein [Enemella evansiae]PFG67534.1 hypothetical protein B0O41_2352 [Propionibacteriaceae bacterium ES.041]OYN98953.1 hypothetical protein CGZ96_06710 [Enemella evansiae]OYO05021.1 hypothetical protein CGZ95_01570 [Enemella evansiae]OYO07481.1 hypothetical protein CGZ98_18695 [Enemella evansiae]OYO12489.1 hypothetical protein BI335_14960 [Enemella evansiae]
MTADFEDVLSRLNDTVDQAATSPELGELPEVEGEAAAYDDRISVKVRAGKVTDLEIQPLAMRLSNADLAEHVTTAVNAALADYAEKITAALTETETTDFGSLMTSTRQLQNDSLRAMKAYTESLFDALNQVKRNG